MLPSGYRCGEDGYAIDRLGRETVWLMETLTDGD